jgi:hypothetical protein
VRHVITAFEVAPDADDVFVREWEQARDPLIAGGACAAVTLHRALRPDVTPRFVELARVASAEPWPDAALYEVVHEHAEPEGDGGVLLIEPFEVPAGEDERFLAGWERVRGVFAARQGYLGTRLHRSLGPADFPLVAIVRWSSPLMYARALQQPEVEEALAAMPFPGRPALYLLDRRRA